MTISQVLLLIVWPLLLTAAGAWVVKKTGVQYRVALAVVVAVALLGAAGFVGLPLPLEQSERAWLALLVGVTAVSVLAVVLSHTVWSRPAWLLLWVPLAFIGGIVLAVNVGFWLGLPH